VELSIEEIAKRPLRRVLKDQKGWLETLDARLLQQRLGLQGYDQYGVFKRMSSAPSASTSAAGLLAAAAARESAASDKPDPYSLSASAGQRLPCAVRPKDRPKAAPLVPAGSAASALTGGGAFASKRAVHAAGAGTGPGLGGAGPSSSSLRTAGAVIAGAPSSSTSQRSW
jgi:hypothetical protein